MVKHVETTKTHQFTTWRNQLLRCFCGRSIFVTPQDCDKLSMVHRLQHSVTLDAKDDLFVAGRCLTHGGHWMSSASWWQSSEIGQDFPCTVESFNKSSLYFSIKNNINQSNMSKWDEHQCRPKFPGRVMYVYKLGYPRHKDPVEYKAMTKETAVNVSMFRQAIEMGLDIVMDNDYECNYMTYDHDLWSTN